MEDKYFKELIKRILDFNSWPNFPGVVNELFLIARDSYSKNTVEGYVASVLILHQIIEEAIKTLIKLSELLVKAHIWPDEIDYQFNEERKMFGEVLREFERSINFKEKKELMAVARKMNNIRSGFVHKLIEMDLNDVKSEAAKFKSLYLEFMKLFNKGEEAYISMLDDLRRNVFLDLGWS